MMLDHEYYHIEDLMNFHQLHHHGFKLRIFPLKWVNTTAAPVRAVAIVED